MSQILELVDKRAKAWETAKAFLDAKRNADGFVSAEDAATYEKMEADVQNLTKEIERLNRQQAIDDELAKATSQPIVGKPKNPVEDDSDKPFRARAEYKKAMLTALRTEFRTISDVLQEGVDSDGGYLVDDEMDSRIIDILEEENIMRKLGTKITTTGEHKINVAASKPAALWVEEGGALTFGDATFDQKFLDAHKLHVAIKVTEELLYDSAFNLEKYITTQFGKALANTEEDAFLNGDGNGKPTGVFHATKGGQIAGTNTAALKSDDILDLVYALKRPYRKGASFIMNDKTLAEIRKLKDGQGNYLWVPSYTLGEPDRIAGFEVRTSAYAPDDKIAFGDYSYYNIGDRGTRSLSVLRELFAGNGMIGYVMKERCDGLLVLPEAVQVLKLKKTTTSGSGS